MKTSLQDLLRQRKESILNQWFHGILDEYEAETASFLKGQKDRFANPVAFALREATEEIYQALLDGRDIDSRTLEYAMKIKAVQENDPVRGTGFIHLLKETIQKALAGSVAEKELSDLDSRIDGIASIAWKMFISNRAKIAEIAPTSGRI